MVSSGSLTFMDAALAVYLYAEVYRHNIFFYNQKLTVIGY